MITGGSGGIGAATVKLLAKSGYNVVFTFCSGEEKASALLDELADEQASISMLQMDLRQPEGIKSALSREIENNGSFDAVVHNAAMTADTAFFFMEEEQWESVLSISLNSFFYINKLVLPHMIAARWGRIITLASVSGEAGNRGQVNYSAAKGALIAATKALAKEVGVKGVLVNAVSPGIIATKMSSGLLPAQFERMIPLRRFGRPEEVATVIRFLVSDDSSYINGTVLQVNGGLYT